MKKMKTNQYVILCAYMNTCDMDDLCYKLDSSEIKYDEMQELDDSLVLRTCTKRFIQETNERYSRYLRNITDWNVHGVSHVYIRDNIVMFLEMNDHDIMPKMKLMRKIDKKLKSVV